MSYVYTQKTDPVPRHVNKKRTKEQKTKQENPRNFPSGPIAASIINTNYAVNLHGLL